jgi:unsaturated rhamnogalacturonyl hydrolase
MLGRCCVLFMMLSLSMLSFFPIQARAQNDKESGFLIVMKKVADWQLSNPRHKNTDWQNGALYAGIMSLYQTTKDEKYLQALLSVGELNDWKLGTRRRFADDHCIGQLYLELYLIRKQPWIIEAVLETFNQMLIAPEKGRTEWYWCDALFMGPPVLALLAAVTGISAYLDFMNTMWWDTTNYLYDPTEHLYFRDERFFNLREDNGRKVFWSRGNGWVIAGLVRVLQYMPEDYSEKGRYILLFREMSDRVISLQCEDGFWRSSLLDPESYPGGESSGTAFFTYAIAWGINSGYLSRETYLRAAEKGWEALASAVETTGKVGWVQQSDDRPRRVKKEDTETYGAGAFLLAGSEIVKLQSTESNTRSKRTAMPVR